MDIENRTIITAQFVTSKPADGTTASSPFPQGTGGSNSFRIPSLVTLRDGTLVAAADARWNTTYDGGGLDTIVSRSTDNGDNWCYTFANYLGDNGNEYHGSSTCFIDPSLVADADDTLYLLVDLNPYGVALNGKMDTAPSRETGFDSKGRLLLSNDNHRSYDYYLDGNQIYSMEGIVQEGYTVDEYFNITGTDGTESNLFFGDSPFKVARTSYLYLTKSTDKGATWSEPTLLNLKTTSEMICLAAPGRGLVTKEGIIIYPVYSYNGAQSTQKSGFIYSSDHGQSWTRSSNYTGADWSSENAVVELSDGTLRCFYRNGTKNLCYADYDLKKGSWGSAVIEKNLHVNSNCQISAITYSKKVEGKEVVLVSCPTGPGEKGSDQSGACYRLNGKIFVGLVNEDKTISWQDAAAIHVTSHDNQFMYSCLTELADGTIGILYENKESAWGTGVDCYYTMTFDIFKLTGLTFD